MTCSMYRLRGVQPFHAGRFVSHAAYGTIGASNQQGLLMSPMSSPQAMCQWVEEVRERLRRFSSESLPLFFLVMWVVVIGVVGSAVIVKILDLFFPTCEHKWVFFHGVYGWTNNLLDLPYLVQNLQNAKQLFLLFLQAHFSPKPCHTNAGGGEAHSAGKHRDRSRGRREEALNEDWLGQFLFYFQFVLICSSTLVTVLRSQHGLVLLAYINIREPLGFVFTSTDPLST